MPAARLNEYGLLNPGLHPMTIEEIAELFAQFQRSDRRMKLMEKLRDFIKAVGEADPRIRVIVDGSFVMSTVDEPDDVDLVLVLPKDWDVAADLRPFEYNVVSKRMVRKRFGFDLVVGVEGEPGVDAAIEFFSRVNVKWFQRLAIPLGTSKGLVQVKT